MTKEDSYPKWLRQIILKAYGDVDPSRLEKGWDQPRRVLLHSVCVPCQRRLNAAFEVPATQLLKDMMSGRPMLLSTAQQRVVAAWMAKTVLVLIMSGPGPAQRSERCRRMLLDMMAQDEPEPADNFSIKLAYFGDERPSVLLPYTERQAAPGDIVFTLAVPGLILEALIGRESTIPFSPEDARYLLFWPQNVSPTKWPPKVHATHADFTVLRAVWKSPSLDVLGNFSPISRTGSSGATDDTGSTVI